MPRDDKCMLFARALISMAEASGRILIIERDLKAAVLLIRGNPDVLKFLADPFIQEQGKADAFDEILADRADPLLTLFLKILLKEGQMADIEAVAAVFSELVAAKKSQISGEIISATHLPKDIIKEIEIQVSRILSKDVSLHPRTDSGILGGVLVKVGDFVINGTIDAELDQAKRELLA